VATTTLLGLAQEFKIRAWARQRGAMAAAQDGRVGEGDDDESMERERLKREAKRTDELVSIIGPVVYLNVVSGTMLWTVRQVSRNRIAVSIVS
jgi:hypothetical protein